MKKTNSTESKGRTLINTLSLSKRIAAVRIGFGVIWAIDAMFKFEPAFYRNFLIMIKAMGVDEPHWLNPWFNTWYKVIGSNPHLFAIMVILLETLISLSLILGIARRLNYALAAIFSFFIWGVGEAFGGPYTSGSTDVGAGIIYVLLFILLYYVDGAIPPSWCLDINTSKRISWWHYIADR